MNNVTGMISRQVADAGNARTIAPLPVAPIAPSIPVKATYTSKTDLSAAAQTALLSCTSNRQGSTCSRMTPQEVLEELQAMGFLGEGWGLTRRGTIKRQILSEDEMDRMFS